MFLINVSNQNAHLQAGTYQGTIVFSTGTGQITVNITFTVQVPPAELTVSPAVLNVRKNCLPNGGGWTCTAFLSSSQNAQTNLHWSANSHFVVQPVQGILSPGMTIPVVIAVPASCATTSTITFNGPDNQATLQLSCTP